jgi:hypothetical protein
MLRPSFTARDIFEIDDPKASKLVIEIGFGNLAIGLASIASLYFPEWIPGMALAGYLLCPCRHPACEKRCFDPARNRRDGSRPWYRSDPDRLSL